MPPYLAAFNTVNAVFLMMAGYHNPEGVGIVFVTISPAYYFVMGGMLLVMAILQWAEAFDRLKSDRKV